MNKIVKYLLLASFIGTVAESCLVPMWAILTKHVDGSIMEAGVGYAIFSIITGITVYLLGKWKKYQDNLHIALMFAFLISGIADFSFIFCTNVAQLFCVQSLLGISVAILNTSWDAIYTDNIDESKSTAEHWSLWNGGISFFQGAGALIAGMFISYFGWVYLFVFMGAMDAVAIIFAYEVYVKMKHGKEN